MNLEYYCDLQEQVCSAKCEGCTTFIEWQLNAARYAYYNEAYLEKLAEKISK